MKESKRTESLLSAAALEKDQLKSDCDAKVASAIAAQNNAAESFKAEIDRLEAEGVRKALAFDEKLSQMQHHIGSGNSVTVFKKKLAAQRDKHTKEREALNQEILELKSTVQRGRRN